MCGIFVDPHEIARSLTIAAANKVVVNQAGMSVEESNIELGIQMAVVYKTILAELTGEDGEVIHSHGHAHSHDDDDFEHEHIHNHAHSHVH